MRLTFLGTSSGVPTRDRGLSAVALRLDDGQVWLVDCGEGTQQRLLASELRLARIERVLLTHLHGDHCFGLPGLLATMGMYGRAEAVEVVAPVGARAWLEVTLATSQLRLPYALDVREIAAAGPVFAGDPALEAWPLVHRAPSFAYGIREALRRGRLDAERARRLGVPAGPLLGELAAGRAVEVAGRRVAPEDVLGPPRPGRVVFVCGDSMDSSAIVEAARGCDVLVHECTYDAARAEQARQWTHSTTAQVAALARAIRPRVLVLTHWSPRYTGADAAVGVEELRREVEAGCPGQRVVAASDGWQLDVPPREAA